jgi:hypothetical protein
MSSVASNAANTTTANVLAGKTFEFVGARPAGVTVAATGGGAGHHMTVQIGNRIIVDDEELSALTTYPKIPDDVVVAGEAAMPGERISVRFRNSTAGALVYGLAVDLDYL